MILCRQLLVRLLRSQTSIRLMLIAVVLLVTSRLSATGGESDDGIIFFENKIRPVLVEHCYGCHSAESSKVKGGLLLDNRESTRAGGDSGAAGVANVPSESLLLSAIRYEEFEMPPKAQLPASVIADFEKWIDMGAPDPRNGAPIVRREIDIDAGREFWAFQDIKVNAVPTVQDTAWPTSDVDQFVLARLEESQLKPLGDADKSTWLRRVTFDLIGMQPTPAELHNFRQDETSTAKQTVVDRLLDSSHFGERWGRHWLDIARYAESTGRTRNYPFHFAWRYRDYVIKSFNEDKPYDQFVIEQLAGDLLTTDDPQERDEFAVATGYLALGSPDLNERNAQAFKMDAVADQIDTVSRSLLGLTVGCARCHDHKFDPIPTDDYYALAGIFKSTKLLNGYTNRGGGGNRLRGNLLIPLGERRDQDPVELSEEEQLVAGLNDAQAAKLKRAKKQLDNAKRNQDSLRNDNSLSRKEKKKKLANARKQLTQKTHAFNQLRNRLGRNQNVKIEGPACIGVRDESKIVDCNIHIRGETNKLGAVVPRGFLKVIERETSEPSSTALPSDASGRLQLAEWIASPANPLTARVYVNRVWRHLFGQGLVRTVDNFGALGARPTHPLLLDYLAARLIQSGWSTKRLIRELVLTRTYGLSVTYSSKHASVDADNALLWRMNLRRLDFESMRDAMLLASGELVFSPAEGSPVEDYQSNELTKQKANFGQNRFMHRSVYLPVVRGLLPKEMSYFDFPESSETRGARDVTTVPTQSLYMMNNHFVINRANACASELLKDVRGRNSEVAEGEGIAAHPSNSASESLSDNARITQAAYRRLFSREATSLESQRIVAYVQARSAELTNDNTTVKNNEAASASRNMKKKNRNRTLMVDSRSAHERAWAEVIHAMFASAEFRYR